MRHGNAMKTVDINGFSAKSEPTSCNLQANPRGFSAAKIKSLKRTGILHQKLLETGRGF
jgi:hypothetical protein